jgi:hypothetical protein
LKLAPLILGMFAIAIVAQPSLAINSNNSSTQPKIDRPASDLQAQLIIDFGGRRPSWRERQRLREIERERERQIQWDRRDSRSWRYSNWGRYPRGDWREYPRDYRHDYRR